MHANVHGKGTLTKVQSLDAANLVLVERTPCGKSKFTSCNTGNGAQSH